MDCFKVQFLPHEMQFWGKDINLLCQPVKLCLLSGHLIIHVLTRFSVPIAHTGQGKVKGHSEVNWGRRF